MGPIYHVSQRGRSSVENSALHPVSGAKCSNHYLFVHSLPLLLANVVVFHQNDGPTVTCPIMRRLSKSYQMFFSFFVSRFSFCYALPIGRERKICGAPVLVRLQSPVWAAALAAGWLAKRDDGGTSGEKGKTCRVKRRGNSPSSLKSGATVHFI